MPDFTLITVYFL